MNSLHRFTIGLLVAALTVPAARGDDLRIEGGYTVSGVLTLANQNLYASWDQPATLSVASSGTLNGYGTVNPGFYGDTERPFSITNAGLIDSSAAGQTLSVNSANGDGVLAQLSNSGGTLRASGGGTLRLGALGACTLDNTNGTILALDGSTVRVGAGLTVQGGTLTTAGSGTIRGDTNGAGGTLSGVTNQGAVLVGANEQLSLTGTLINNGTVRVIADYSQGTTAYLYVSGNATLGGTGTLSLAGPYGNFLVGQGNADLTIAAGATVAGGGFINTGFNGPGFINVANAGTLDANVAGDTLQILVGVNGNTPFSLTNTGLLRASNGGTLSVVTAGTPGTVDNTGGTIEALAGSNVTFDGSVTLANNQNGTLTGGTYRAVGSGAVLNLPGPAPTALAGGAQIIIANGGKVLFDGQPVNPALVSPSSFFVGQVALSQGAYYLAFPNNGNIFGYYAYLSDPNYFYHFDLGYEYVFDAGDGKAGVYLYDFASSTFFYTSPVFPFPYLYDFSLNAVLYYYPDPNNPGHYNTNGVRYFYNFATGKIINK